MKGFNFCSIFSINVSIKSEKSQRTESSSISYLLIDGVKNEYSTT